MNPRNAGQRSPSEDIVWNGLFSNEVVLPVVEAIPLSISIKNVERREWSSIAATFAGRNARGKICLES